MRAATERSASDRIDQLLADHGDWRGELLARLRRLIHEADPEVEEDLKWAKASHPVGVPSHHWLLCTGELYNDKVKLTFADGAALPDPTRLFNASLDAGTRRAVDLREGDDVDAAAFTALVRAAVEHRRTKAATKQSR